jgi:hypothetical protein
MAIQLLGHNAGMLVAAEVGSFDAPERVRGLGGLHTGAYGVGLLGALSCLPRPAHRSLWRRLAGCPFLLAAAAAAARRAAAAAMRRDARVLANTILLLLLRLALLLAPCISVSVASQPCSGPTAEWARCAAASCHATQLHDRHESHSAGFICMHAARSALRWCDGAFGCQSVYSAHWKRC